VIADGEVAATAPASCGTFDSVQSADGRESLEFGHLR
jgi:hypothetical protein